MEYRFNKNHNNIAKINSDLQKSTIAAKILSLTSHNSDILIETTTTLTESEQTELYAIMGLNIPRDYDGAQLIRAKQAPIGWTYQAHCFEFCTSELGSTVSQGPDGSDTGFLTMQLKDAEGQIIAEQATADTSCPETIVDWEPTFDYEIIAGRIFLKTNSVNNDVRVWVIGVPDLPVEAGGNKVMACGLNIDYIDAFQPAVTDGRVSKRMNYDAVYHTNKLRFLMRHPAGVKVDIMFVLDFYKA